MATLHFIDEKCAIDYVFICIYKVINPMLLLINNYIFVLDPQPKTLNGELSKFAKFSNKVVEVEFKKRKITYELHKNI
jgi:hypothetical protein